MVIDSDDGSASVSARNVRPDVAPAAPAIAADSANTPTLVAVRFSPRVAQAIGESFMAVSRRPQELRRRTISPIPMAAKRAAEKISWL